MLMKCPECQLQVSDKAMICPHCGYPLKEQKPAATRKRNKRRRLPNGFGQISEIKGRNLRKPFRAMITVGKTETGKPICKLLKPEAFFKTYNDAYAALIEHNKDPYNLGSLDITMEEMYEKWKTNYLETGNSEKSLRSQSYVWEYCKPLSDVPVKEIRSPHLYELINNAGITVNGKNKPASANTKNRIKSLMNSLFDYAVKFGITDRNYARAFTLGRQVSKQMKLDVKHHEPYTSDEMTKMWNALRTVPNVDLLIIQCYTGLRPQEIGLIEISNVNLRTWTMRGGMKTEAGTNRLIPIHSKIRSLIEKRYKQSVLLKSKYLFNAVNSDGTYKQLTYDRYKTIFYRIRDDLAIGYYHKPHDGRTHFVTAAKNAKMDEYAIKYIIGHEIKDITESTYTKRPPEWLSEEIEKIK